MCMLSVFLSVFIYLYNLEDRGLGNLSNSSKVTWPLSDLV